MKIEISGGAYAGREGLVIERDTEKELIIVSGWYDGGEPLDVEINIPTAEFLERLGLNRLLS